MQTLSEILYTFCPSVTASNIALAKGWFEEEFVDDGIKLSNISSLPIEFWQAHQTHKHEHLIRDGGNIPPIWAKSEGVDTVVTGMVWVCRGNAILVSNDSAIESVKELKDKRVAVLRRLANIIDFPRASEKRAILMSVKAHGLAEEDIKFVDIPIFIGSIASENTVPQTSGVGIEPKTGWDLPQQPEVEALQNGEVDAIWARGGQEFLLEKTGQFRIIYNDLVRHPDLEYRVNIEYPYICTVNADFANKYPEIITRWMKVLVKAGIWAQNNYTEVLKIMSRVTHMPEEAFVKSFAQDFHKHLVPEISEDGIKALEIEKHFLKEHGFINNDFNVRTWIDGTYLETAMKELQG